MKALIAAAFLTVLSPAAFAQAPPAGPGPGGPPMAQPPGPPPGGPEGRRSDGPPGGHGMGEHHGRMHHMRHHGPPPSKGARFRFERGEIHVDVKCDDDEPMRACVEAAVMLIDKLGSMR